MKKKYIICFLSVLMLAYGAYKITYMISVNKFKDEKLNNNYSQMTIDANTPIVTKISPVTEFVYEFYNINTKKLTSKCVEAPVKYYGLTKEEFYQKLNEEIPEENVVKVELITFSKDKVVIRNTIAYEITAKYFLKAIDEKIIIYMKDKKTVYDYADINTAQMPEIIRNKLSQGIYIESNEELYEFLQNYSS